MRLTTLFCRFISCLMNDALAEALLFLFFIIRILRQIQNRETEL